MSLRNNNRELNSFHKNEKQQQQHRHLQQGLEFKRRRPRV